MSSLDRFHPALRRWFEQHLGQPTEPQARAWPAIQEGRHTLIAAPTGSGKTLAAFYAVINQLVMAAGENGQLPVLTRVVYVSPLKALSNDIHRNLEIPLRGIEQQMVTEWKRPVKISAAVRTGDTTPAERQKMMRYPPHILVTTPESLYLLLTSKGGRDMLRGVRTLILDEIHALLGDKRGSHLALSVERLEALTKGRLQRIGLSATQKPIDLVARFLAGNANLQNGKPDCVVIDTGHRRKLDLRLEVPRSPLTAVMSNEVWTEIYERLVELIGEHKTTLIFVNTRRLAERLARALAERIGEEHVNSHHGSMSKEHRLAAERRLKAGELRVLVATASMELGIDIGSVELVVQFSSPKRIAAFLQRVGRSGHYVGGTPKGILFPLSRDELLECTALLDSVRRGELDRILMPEEPLDILSQQIVAEVSSREWNLEDLYQLFHKAYPYRNLSKEKFVSIVRMVSEGFVSRGGRRGAYLHYDAVNGRVRARRGARIAALTNGGAIPDMFDYEVVMEPEGITVGTLNEDFALESLPGDIFTLGTHSWQLLKIEGLKVMVQDAAGKPPTVPFWLGESAARSSELSESLSRLRETVSAKLDASPLYDTEQKNILPDHPAVIWLVQEAGIPEAAAEQLVMYLWMGKTGLGVMPSQERLVMERFFDEAGDMHVVLHSPYGSRLNRAWGLALRKKFCRTFNFELQAAANENSIILSLTSSHSFPLESVAHFLNSKTVRATLIQAMLDAPLFEIRWRWNAARSLAILRNRHGKRVPPYLQRLQAQDLISQVFPGQLACFENRPRDIEIPEHPLVEQVIHDCLTEAMDIEALEELLRKMEHQEIEWIAKDLREPSIFAQEIIHARPYAFLDDTEFAERRVNAIRNRGWLDPSEARDLGRLEPEAIRRVREEAWPEAQNADELHDALMTCAFFLEKEGKKWANYFEELTGNGRAARFRAREGQIFWIAAERSALFEAVYPGGFLSPDIKLPADLLGNYSADDALREIIRGRLEVLGPVTVDTLARESRLPETQIRQALLALENEGFVFRGMFTPDLGLEEWCERRLLERIHRYSIESLRQSIQPVSLQDFMQYLFWHHGLDREEQLSGPDSLQRVLDQLEGFEAPASSWEQEIIPSRIGDYDPVWLDVLCMSGRIVWSRFHTPRKHQENGAKAGPVRNTPICLVARSRLNLWRRLSEWAGAESKLSHTAEMIRSHLKSSGAVFFEDLVKSTALLPSQVERGIAELVSQGLISSDSYAGLRALLTPASYKASRARRKPKPLLGIEHAGRWSLTENYPVDTERKPDYETLEEVVFIYLRRWGVVFRSLMEKEPFAPPWRELVRVLRRMELRGEIRGGRFVSHVSGEQFALPETVEALRKIRSKPKSGNLISISAADPLNLEGILLPGKRIARLTSNRILYQDGIAVAFLEGKKIRYFKDHTAHDAWPIQKALVRGRFPAKLGYYLRKA